jgi:hypothetical protein
VRCTKNIVVDRYLIDDDLELALLLADAAWEGTLERRLVDSSVRAATLDGLRAVRGG